MTGVIFSGELYSDIHFDYGIFRPGCRWASLADMRGHDLKIDLRMAHLSADRPIPNWKDVMARLRIAVDRLK